MTNKEFLRLIESGKEAYEMYKEKGNNFTLKDIELIVNRARQEEDLFYQKKLNNIRKKVYDFNKEVGFYGCAGIEYKEFLEVMKGYTYEERMKIAYAFFQHIALLDNIVFDVEGEA